MSTSPLIKPKEWRLKTFVYALITATLIFLPFIFIDNGYFIYCGDFNEQQLAFYKHCHDAIWNGGGTGWDWMTDLGSSFVGSYAYYSLGSPFLWIALLFPSNAVPYLMAPLLMIKIALAALTAYIYLRRYVKTPQGACMGGLLYAFSGWSLYNIFFNTFHEPLILFPLVLYGIDEIVYNKRKGVLALSVFAAAMCNFYFFVDIAIFAIVYWVVRSVFKTWDMTFKTFLSIAFEAIVGFMMSAVIMLPAILEVLQVPRVSGLINGWDALGYGKTGYFQILWSMFFPSDCPATSVIVGDKTWEWCSLTMWLPVCGMFGVFTWCTNNKKDWITRLLAISLIILLVPGLCSMFNMFNHIVYARWLFMPLLFCVMATIKAYEAPGLSFKKPTKVILSLMTVLLLIAAFFPQKDENENLIFGLYERGTGGKGTSLFLIYIIITVFSLGAYFAVMYYRRKDMRKRMTTVAISSICAISVFLGCMTIASGRGYTFDANYFVDEYLAADVKLDLGAGKRVDIASPIRNAGMVLGYPSTTAFHSVVSGSIYEYYDYLGGSRMLESAPRSDDYAARTFLGTEYLLYNEQTYQPLVEDKADENGASILRTFTQDGKLTLPGYKKMEEQSGYIVYKNTCSIPQGFTLDSYYSYGDVENASYLQKSQLMLKGVLLTDEQIKKYASCFKDGELIKSKITLDSVNYGEKAYIEDCKKINENAHIENLAVENNGSFGGSITTAEPKLVIFSVPYDKGWTATIDGQPVKIEKINAGFMGVMTSAGTHNIKFEFHTQGLELGAVVSTVGIVVLVAYLAANYVLKKRKK